MTEEKNCEKCGMRDSCGKIFKLLDKNQDKKIGVKFIVAFFVPLVIFIISLITIYSIFRDLIQNEILSGIISVGSSFLLVLIYAFIFKIINKRKG